MGLTEPKLKCQQKCVPSGGYSVKSVSLPFSALRCTHIPWLMTSSIVKSLTFLLPSFAKKDPCDYIGITWIFQDNILIWLATSDSSATLMSPLPHTQGPGIRKQEALGDHYSAYNKHQIGWALLLEKMDRYFRKSLGLLVC